MTIDLPNLDDRRFKDLVQEVRALIPRYAPDWTDHNPTDPGITLLELFAWVTETLFFRANRAHVSSRARLLQMLGASFKPARPASVMLQVETMGSPTEQVIPAGEILTTGSTGSGERLEFETIEDLWLQPQDHDPQHYAGVAEAWQMERVTGETLGVGDGQPFQRFDLRHHVVVQKREHFLVVPAVSVAGEPWQYKGSLVEASRSDDKHFTVDPYAGVVQFGDSVSGQAPATGAVIEADYRYCLGAQSSVAPGGIFRFDRELGFEPSISVVSAKPGTDPTGLDAARAEAIAALRTPYRAITAPDFERLVLEDRESEIDVDIARVKCLPGVDLTAAEGEKMAVEDHVSVIVVPNAGLPKPVPSAEQLNQVHKFLDKRRLITCRHHVVGPQYTDFRVTARVAGAHLGVEQALELYFSPLPGSPDADSRGWEFGRGVHASEVYEVIEGVQGVDHVEELTLEKCGDDNQWIDAGGRVAVPPTNLVFLAKCDITSTGSSKSSGLTP